MPRQRVSTDIPGVDHRSVVVLKFGGSVLRNEDDIRTAVHEIYRWVRGGHRVVAVVSALEGTTDALISKARTYGASPDSIHPGAYAALLATGEQTSAALLGLALDRAGIPLEVLDAAAADLRTSGTTIDAFPESINASGLLDILERVPVIVLPGFIGRDGAGRTTLLGRGGSDLTALFVAERLIAAGAPNVRCRLIKDVSGLYEFDPVTTRNGRRPARYTSIHWNGALALDGDIVQHKAVRYARENDLSFEVGATLAEHATQVGNVETRIETPGINPGAGITRVVLLGCGTVGLGVYQRLRALPERFEIVRVAARDLERAAASGAEPRLLTSDIMDAASSECDVVIEAAGGIEPARTAIERALRAATNVVTANKAVIAAHGSSLQALAAENGVALSYSASVGGATPAIETVRRARESDDIVEIVGVLNGTTNFVLGLVDRGIEFSPAVREAQRAGFAEADPSRDLDGRDAGDKLCVLAQEAWGVALDPADITRQALTAEEILSAQATARPDGVIRHVGRLVREDAGTVRATVSLEVVPFHSPLGRVAFEWNAIVVRTRDGAEHVTVGRGAGRWPTSESVIADVLEIVLAHGSCECLITRQTTLASAGGQP